jgi:hypothetical protein
MRDSRKRIAVTGFARGQIESTEWTPDGHLRHSKLVGLREDKAGREVMRRVKTSKENPLRLFAYRRRGINSVNVYRQTVTFQAEEIFLAVLTCRTCSFYRVAVVASFSLTASLLAASWLPFF